MAQSPFELAKAIQGLVQSNLTSLDVDALPTPERDLLRAIKRQLGDIRLDIRDYGMAETKLEQIAYGIAVTKQLQLLQKRLLQASEYGVFGAADMAIISAHIEQLMAELKE
ncbi:MAG TPA: hypothetical protein VLF43_02640 [Candidatus Saccharimonadales bacterium]|nr:hypothetical protein [Candidatus Saccharimonadales bacterium]